MTSANSDGKEQTENERLPRTALVVGAAGGIGSAVLQQFAADARIDRVFAVSRQSGPATGSESDERIVWLQCSGAEDSIASVCEQLAEQRVDLTRVVICCGVLHGEEFGPEKSLEQITSDVMLHVLGVNAVVPVLWLRGIAALLGKRARCTIAVLSARVGSISDNSLGGWYSYRASKAALNMLLQTASIECARRTPDVKLIAFHPGTTETPLSEPFRKNVAPEKLFTPAFVAKRLLGLMDDARADGQLDYLDWDGKPIKW